MIHFNTKAELIAALSAIPDEQWCVGDYVIGSACCALGHIGYRDPRTPDDYKINDDLNRKFRLVIPAWDFDNMHYANDERNPKFNQSTPKARVLAYLESL